MERFINFGIIKNELNFDAENLEFFEKELLKMNKSKQWEKNQLVKLFYKLLPEFQHTEVGKYLDDKM